MGLDYENVSIIHRRRRRSPPNATPTGTAEIGWESAYYIYSSSHPHVVSNVQHDGVTDDFDYDNAGNMTSRSVRRTHSASLRNPINLDERCFASSCFC
jgi:hypothetical protein